MKLFLLLFCALFLAGCSELSDEYIKKRNLDTIESGEILIHKLTAKRCLLKDKGGEGFVYDPGKGTCVFDDGSTSEVDLDEYKEQEVQ